MQRTLVLSASLALVRTMLIHIENEAAAKSYSGPMYASVNTACSYSLQGELS